MAIYSEELITNIQEFMKNKRVKKDGLGELLSDIDKDTTGKLRFEPFNVGGLERLLNKAKIPIE